MMMKNKSDFSIRASGDGYAEKVCRAMERVDWHVYQVLTKRSERLRDLLSGKLQWAGQCPHIIWGVSVENRKHGLPRIDDLRQTPEPQKLELFELVLIMLTKVYGEDAQLGCVLAEFVSDSGPMN